MKRSMTILSIILLSFSIAFAAGTGSTGGSSGANASSTSSASTTSGGTPSGGNANNVGTLNSGSFTGTTTTGTTGTVGSATIAPTTVNSATVGTSTTTVTANQIGVGVTPAELNTLFQNFVAVNQLGNLSTVQLNTLFTQFRSVLTNPAMSNGLIVNPLTGQEVNVFANPFNTGLGKVTNSGTTGTVIQTATGNLAAFPTGAFPNGVVLNVNFPLNVNSTGTTLINPNTNLTNGAGSTGFTSTTTSNGSEAGLRFPTMTLSSRGLIFDTVPMTANLKGQAAFSGGVHTTVKAVIQRDNGTFTNVRTIRKKR